MSYKLTHPESDLEIEVQADVVAVYTSQGWETKPTAKPPTEGDDKKK
jgi:hypothetical protein